MARTYRMTPKRRAALKRAQAASARKRRGKGKGKLASANRRYDARSKRTRRGMKIAGALAVAGGVGYAAHKTRSVNSRKNSAIKEAKTIQQKSRDNFRKAKAAYTKNPNDKKAKMRLRAARRMLRASSAMSVHKAIIKKHTGR